MLSKELQAEFDGLTATQKKQIEARYQELKEEYLTLQQLRQLKNVTQKDLANLLGIEQANVSRMERRKDMKLSTLNEYIEALGGSLQINAVFPDHVVTIR